MDKQVEPHEGHSQADAGAFATTGSAAGDAKPSAPAAGDKGVAVRVLVMQLVGYLCMAGLWCACAESDGPSWILAVGACVFIAIFIAAYPFAVRTPSSAIARIMPALAGACGIAFSLVCDSDAAWMPWFVSMAAVLVLVAFLYELLRADRAHMIFSMSTTLFSGLLALCALGWSVAPAVHRLGAVMAANPAVGWATAVVMALVPVLLGVASVLWAVRMSPADYARIPTDGGRAADATRHVWIAWGLMPVMLYGAVVAIASWVLLVI